MSKEVSFKSRLVLSVSLDTFYMDKNYVASEFIEKAILFYIGYMSQQDNLNYISPMITETVKAQINGTEQRLARLLFKVAVELGKLMHLLAAANDVDDETLRQLLVMCINEVRKINDAIDCEDAVRYQADSYYSAQNCSVPDRNFPNNLTDLISWS